MTASRRVIIGVGNEFRQDDGAGIAVARRLREMHVPGTDVVVLSGEGTEILQILRDSSNVVIVDAVLSGEPAGTVHRLDASRVALPPNLKCGSSHLFGVAEAVEMARELGVLPQACWLYGIEGRSFEYGNSLSHPVGAAVDQVVAELSSPIEMGG